MMATITRVAGWILLAFLTDAVIFNSAARVRNRRAPEEPTHLEKHAQLADGAAAEGKSGLDKFVDEVSKGMHLQNMPRENLTQLATMSARLMVILEGRQPGPNPLDQVEEKDRKLLLRVVPLLGRFMLRRPQKMLSLLKAMLPDKMTPEEYIKENIHVDEVQLSKLDAMEKVALIYMWAARGLDKGLSETLELAKGVLQEDLEEQGDGKQQDACGEFMATLHFLRRFSRGDRLLADAIPRSSRHTKEESEKLIEQSANEESARPIKLTTSSPEGVTYLADPAKDPSTLQPAISNSTPPIFFRAQEQSEESATRPAPVAASGPHDQAKLNKSTISIKLEITMADKFGNPPHHLLAKTAQMELDDETLEDQKRRQFSDVLHAIAGSNAGFVVKQKSKPSTRILQLVESDERRADDATKYADGTPTRKFDPPSPVKVCRMLGDDEKPSAHAVRNSVSNTPGEFDSPILTGIIVGDEGKTPGEAVQDGDRSPRGKFDPPPLIGQNAGG